MAVTEKELRELQDFASSRLASGEAECMADLVQLWEESRRSQRSDDALRRSHEEAEAGQLVSAETAFADARRILGIRE